MTVMRDRQANTATPFPERIDLVRPVLPSMEEMLTGLEDILISGMVTKGRCLRQFEDAIAEHLRVGNAIAVSSCTAGLMLAYRCLALTGDVIVPSFTFMATVSALIWAGLRPVFVDVQADSATLDPAALTDAITADTTAIVATHVFGNPADIATLEKIAEEHGLRLIFDAAHGFGTLYDGRPLGPQGDAQVFSLSPTKLLIAGEGGIVTTSDDELASALRLGREYGNDGRYNSAFAGMNARMPEINALMGLKSLERLEEAAIRRNELAARYRSRLGDLPGIGFQTVRPQDRCSYKDFSITVDPELSGFTRDDLAHGLAAQNIDSRNYYDPPVHRQTAYAHFHDGRPLPNTDLLAERSISLPLWSVMEDSLVDRIADTVTALWVRPPEAAGRWPS